MEDLDDLTQSSEMDSECIKLLYPNDEGVFLLIEQLRKGCKDSGALLKIQDTICSYKRLIQSKDRHCQVLTGKLKTMEDQVSGLEKKLSEAEHDQVTQEQELCTLRFTLKQEEERRKNTDWVCKKIKEQLREKEEQFKKETEVKQQLEVHVRELDVKLKTALEELNDTQSQLFQEQNTRILQDETLTNHLDKQKELQPAQEKISSELHQAQDHQHATALGCTEKTQDHMQKLEFENHKLKVKVTKQAEKIKLLKKSLLSANLNEDLAAKLENIFSKCFHLDEENRGLRQELSAMNTTQNKCEKLQKHKKILEQEVLNLQTHMENNMIDCGQIQQYQMEAEEKEKQDLIGRLKQVNLFLQVEATFQANLENLRCKQNASIRSKMELRIRDLESELSKVKSQVDSNKIKMASYKQQYLEEVRLRKLVSNKLSQADTRLAEVTTKLLLERQRKRSPQHSTFNTRPAPKSTCAGDLRNSILIPTSFSRESLWPSVDTMHNYKTRVLQEWEQSVNGERKTAAVEFESGFFRTSPLELTHK